MAVVVWWCGVEEVIKSVFYSRRTLEEESPSIYGLKPERFWVLHPNIYHKTIKYQMVYVSEDEKFNFNVI